MLTKHQLELTATAIREERARQMEEARTMRKQGNQQGYLAHLSTAAELAGVFWSIRKMIDIKATA